ncbi:MAG: class F sortase [Candidatus Roizmanbacteria bacterium]|nr:class F sortase [Candidatus Roizmanbacteria bacterium]
MKKLRLLFFIGLAATAAIVHNALSDGRVVQTDGIVAGTSQYSASTPEPVTEEVSLTPVLLSIPSLDIFDVTVEHVGLDAQERMDVPRDPLNVAWYERGPEPGKKGNAVIAGHFDLSNGDPGVFAHIGDLETGNTVEVYDATGKELTFKVVDKQIFPDAEFPISLVFGKHDASRLNLITCAGEFDKATKNYSHRLVVFTELIES